MNNYLFTNYNSDDILWDGPNIPCLKLCKGDMVSSVVYKLGQRVCELHFNSLDTLDLSCLIDHCQNCDDDYSLKHIFQLMLDNDCSVKELIDKLVDVLNGKLDIKFDLDFSCLTTCHDYNSPPITGFNCDPYPIVIDPADCPYGSYNVEDCDCESFNTDIIVNSCNEQQDFTITQLLQFLIKKLCCQGQLLDQVSTKVDEVEEAYQTIVSGLSIYQEPVLTTCLNSSGRIHSLVTGLLVSKVCELESNLGTLADIMTASSQQCLDDHLFTFSVDAGSPDVDFANDEILLPGIYTISDGQPLVYSVGADLASITELTDGQTYYAITTGVTNNNGVKLSLLPSPLTPIDLLTITTPGGTPPSPVNTIYFEGLVPVVNNLSNNSQNQWVVLCDIWNRLSTIKQSDCCLPSCKDIKIGFAETYIEDENIYRLIFSPEYGNSVPSGWEDCGSKITIEDYKGIFFTYTIDIANEFTFDLDLTGLDLSKPFTLSIKTCLTHDETSLNCKECIVKTLPAIPSGCDFCRICAGGSKETDTVKITYYTADNKNVRSSILTPSTCLTFKLPDEEPTITSITVLTTGSDIEVFADPSTQCSEDLVLPNPKINTCWFFPLPVSDVFASFIDKLTTTTNISILPPIDLVAMDIDMTSNYLTTYTYSSIKSDMGTFVLSNKTIKVNSFSKGNPLSPGANPDILTINVDSPVVVPGSSIISSSPCGLISIEHLEEDGNDPNKAGVRQLLTSTFSIPNGGIELKYQYTVDSAMGIVLELQGQDPNSIPELTIEDPVTGTKMIIKGNYLEDSCECE